MAINLSISFRVGAGESYDCPSNSSVTLKDIENEFKWIH